MSYNSSVSNTELSYCYSVFDTEVSDAPVYDTVLDTERFLIQSYQLNKVHIVQCLGCSTIKVNLRGRTQSQCVFSHTSTKMCSYFYINICVSGARYYLYHKDKVSDRFMYFSVTLNAFVSH